MSEAALFPNALDYVRCMHDNAVDNLLIGKRSYVDFGSLYRRAYAVTYETGYVNLRPRFAVPDTTNPRLSTPITR
jgi:hypothetical protein